MGKYIKVLIFLLFFLLLNITCFAQEADYDDFTQNAPEEFKNSSIDDIEEQLTTESLVERLITSFGEGIKNTFKTFLMLCGIIILFSLLKNLQVDNSFLNKSISAVIPVSIIALLFDVITDTLSSISECIDSSTVFCSTAVPVILGLCISSGNSFSGASFSSTVSFVSVLMQRISDVLLLPLTVISLSFSLVGELSPNINIAGVDKQIKKFIKYAIGIFIAIFSLSMSLQNFLSASSDSMLKRSVKNAVGSFIPIVGNTLSSSIDSIFTIASNSKTTFSVLGIVIIIAIYLPALIQCLCYGLSLSMAKTFATFLNENNCARVIGCVADVFYIISGICAACVIMMILSFLIVCLNIS